MWNYRRVTWIAKPTEKQASLGFTPIRMFGVVEVYYNDKGEPNSWAVTKTMFNDQNLDGLKVIYDTLARVFDEPVLDLDSWKRKGNILKEYVE